MEKCDKLRILIVDDERGIRDLFKKMISFDIPECSVDLAVNGAEAINVFRQTHPAVVMMDLSMPVMDGEAACKGIMKLCEEQDWEKPAVVFCTGFAPPNTIQDFIKGDPKHALLPKPVSREVIIDTLKARL